MVKKKKKKLIGTEVISGIDKEKKEVVKHKSIPIVSRPLIETTTRFSDN